jgi:hypothetical protein
MKTFLILFLVLALRGFAADSKVVATRDYVNGVSNALDVKISAGGSAVATNNYTTLAGSNDLATATSFKLNTTNATAVNLTVSGFNSIPAGSSNDHAARMDQLGTNAAALTTAIANGVTTSNNADGKIPKSNGTGTNLTISGFLSAPVASSNDHAVRLDMFNTNVSALTTMIANSVTISNNADAKVAQTNAVIVNFLQTTLAPTSATNYLVNGATGNRFYILATNNVFLVQPTNVPAGWDAMLDIVQDTTGTRSVTYNTNFWKFASLQQLTITTNANAWSVLSLKADPRGNTNVAVVEVLNFQ